MKSHTTRNTSTGLSTGTSPLLAPGSLLLAPPPRRRGGFTLVEMLVVIGIIIVLLGIALPAIHSARQKGLRTRMAMDLQVISQALEAYRQDFKDYPRVDYSNANLTPGTLGAVTLCWALLSPGPATGNGSDGADGPGFRVRGTQGQIYGPYIQPGKFKISGSNDWNSTINDENGNPYLYFPRSAGANINVANGYIGNYTSSPPTPRPMYNFGDNSGVTSPNGSAFTQQMMETQMGDLDNNGGINGAEVPATTAPYILWGAGGDSTFGPPPYNTSAASDDVTNFN